jgi:hypothetical protein
MPERSSKPDTLDRILDRLFGGSRPFAEHIFQMTVIYLLLLLCLWITRRWASLLFPVSEQGMVATFAHFVDAYAAILATIGYVVWLSVDMVFLFIDRLKERKKD